MNQHFLLSSKAKTLSVAKVARMTEEEAYELFKEVRWSVNDGDPVCPHCGSIECWTFNSRPVFKCKHCNKQFSVTSGTIFSGRKLQHRDYLLAIAIFVNSCKGVSALQLSRDLGVQYKTAFVLAHKLREVTGDEMQDAVLTGEVEVDGAYFGGYLKPRNWKENRVDRRLRRHQNGKRRCVFAIREREGRVVPVVIKSETSEAVTTAIRKHIDSQASIHADENAAYDALHAQYQMFRINHSRVYSDGEACTNGAEGWFSRLRRAEIGQHHHIAGKYLHSYANEMAYKENRRRQDNGSLFGDLLFKSLNRPMSRNWAGYWQGNNQPGEVLLYPH
jgi:transposase-like protein